MLGDDRDDERELAFRFRIMLGVVGTDVSFIRRWYVKRKVENRNLVMARLVRAIHVFSRH